MSDKKSKPQVSVRNWQNLPLEKNAPQGGKGYYYHGCPRKMGEVYVGKDFAGTISTNQSGEGGFWVSIIVGKKERICDGLNTEQKQEEGVICPLDGYDFVQGWREKFKDATRLVEEEFLYNKKRRRNVQLRTGG